VTHEPPVSHLYRRQQLSESLPDGIDALLVCAAENIRYLTGFTGSNGSLLIGRAGDATLATDGRYSIQAAEQAPDVECIEARAVGPALVARAVAGGQVSVGFEPDAVTLALHDRLSAAAEGGKLVRTEQLVERLRAVKDAAEIDALRVACQITDVAFEQVVLKAQVGVSERDLAFALTTAMRQLGAEADAFDPIVAFGPHSAIPHHPPSDRALATGDFVKTDFGARYAGYHADLTRTVVVGTPAGWQRDLHAAVRAVQAGGRAAATAGASPSNLDRDAHTGIEAAGFRMAHGLGHGVGLQIHEDPFLTPASPAGPLAAGMVLTIEPGGYIEGSGGVRIEDTLVIRDGEPELLTNSPRELIEIWVILAASRPY
jgi:Xaa-Pro aminopeptidase